MSPTVRLGFPVKVMARPDLKSNDARRWAKNPHLRTSLEYLDAILDHCAKHRIRMYRMSSDLAPYATHPDMPQFHGMVAESDAELAAIGRKARALDIRLSFHPSQYVLLNSPDPELTAKSVWDLASQAEMLDRMELGPEAVLVTHVGGTYGDRDASNARWVSAWDTLPEPVRRRLVLEHDDLRFSPADTLWIHERTGVPLVFDHQHFWCLNPEGLDLRDTLARMLRTWPAGVRPKVHFSSPRTELRELKRKDPKTRKVTTVNVAPVWTGHADFVHPFEFIAFMRLAEGLEFDVMLEAKAKDLALIRLRTDLLRYAPDVAVRFGLTPAEAPALEQSETEVLPPPPRSSLIAGGHRAPACVRSCKASFRSIRLSSRLHAPPTGVPPWQRARPELLLVKHFVSASPIHNLGLFAGEPIKKDREVWRFEPDYDVEIPAAMLADLEAPYREVVRDCAEYFADRDVYRLGNDGDIFMNHSDRPNLLDLGDRMVAAWDIAAGEELTCNYRTVHVAGYRPPPTPGPVHGPT